MPQIPVLRIQRVMLILETVCWFDLWRSWKSESDDVELLEVGFLFLFAPKFNAGPKGEHPLLYRMTRTYAPFCSFLPRLCTSSFLMAKWSTIQDKQDKGSRWPTRAGWEGSKAHLSDMTIQFVQMAAIIDSYEKTKPCRLLHYCTHPLCLQARKNIASRHLPGTWSIQRWSSTRSEQAIIERHHQCLWLLISWTSSGNRAASIESQAGWKCIFCNPIHAPFWFFCKSWSKPFLPNGTLFAE